MATKSVSLKDSTQQEVFRSLTSGLEELGLINLHELSRDGVLLSKEQMIKMIDNINYFVDYSVVRGHIMVPDVANISYTDKYFGYERTIQKVQAGNFNIYLKSFEQFTFYISESNWIDLHFTKADGTYVTMVLVP